MIAFIFGICWTNRKQSIALLSMRIDAQEAYPYIRFT